MKSQSRIVARYAETDQMGVIHHAVYPVWYEVARTDYIKKLGISYSDLEKLGVMTPLVELSCRYISPARYEDELIAEVAVGDLSPARVEFQYQVFRIGEHTPLNTGRTLHAWVDAKTFRPVNMKKRYLGLYASIERAWREEQPHG